MKQLLSVIALVLAMGAGALAHNGNDHVRGVVTAVSAQSVTVQLADKSVKTLAISAKTGSLTLAAGPSTTRSVCSSAVSTCNPSKRPWKVCWPT